MTDHDDDRDRVYPTLLHAPRFWWALLLCGLGWVAFVAWAVRA